MNQVSSAQQSLLEKATPPPVCPAFIEHCQVIKSGNPRGNISVSLRVIEHFIFERFIAKAWLLLSFPATSCHLLAF